MHSSPLTPFLLRVVRGEKQKINVFGLLPEISPVTLGIFPGNPRERRELPGYFLVISGRFPVTSGEFALASRKIPVISGKFPVTRVGTPVTSGKSPVTSGDIQ